MKRLDDFFAGSGAPPVTGVTADSRRVRPGFLYVAIPGTRADGLDFAPEAAAAGAVAVVAERPAALPVPLIQVASARVELTRLLRIFYDFPETRLDCFGVTGTNGKTTSVYLAADFLRRAGRRGGMLSTVEFRTPDSVEPATHTTPDPETFYALLARIVREGGRNVAMELSSHSLDQHRTDGVAFRAAVFTNLTGDHLDYHRTMECYYAAKRRLFTELLAPDGRAIVNCDDPFGRRLTGELRERGRTPVTFGAAADADCRIEILRLSAAGTRFRLTRGGRSRELETALLGAHNLHNLLGAMLGAEALGADWEALCGFAADPRPAPGRLEPLRRADGAVFFIDYAHTDDALTQVLGALRQLAGDGRLIAVFGCGGDRDRTKRPRMGRAAAAADLAIVTSDNPRSEDPAAIIREILPGIPAGTEYRVEPDRREAIRLAARLARPGDLILIAGKGHETYQEIAGVRHPFSDREAVSEAIR